VSIVNVYPSLHLKK